MIDSSCWITGAASVITRCVFMLNWILPSLELDSALCDIK